MKKNYQFKPIHIRLFKITVITIVLFFLALFFLINAAKIRGKFASKEGDYCYSNNNCWEIEGCSSAHNLPMCKNNKCQCTKRPINDIIY